jgi:predicted NUDIX family NTP pyrophosphohydrolase
MRKSAGILVYRRRSSSVEFFLVHPGGPFWKNKDVGAWSVPKGEFEEGEDPLKAARREFEEETGIAVNGEFVELKPVKQKSGKVVYAWAIESDMDLSEIVSNTFMFEWPPKSGKYIEIPEVDKGGWFTYEEAKAKLIPGQVPILEELWERVGVNGEC